MSRFASLLPASLTDLDLHQLPTATEPGDPVVAGAFFKSEVGSRKSEVNFSPLNPPGGDADRDTPPANIAAPSLLSAARDGARAESFPEQSGRQESRKPDTQFLSSCVPNSPARALRMADVEDGLIRRQAVLFAREQLAQGVTWAVITRRGRKLVRRHLSWWFKLVQSVEQIPNHLLTAEHCAPRSKWRGGKVQVVELTDAEVQAVRALVLTTNRTWNAGSVPVALKAAARQGQLRPEVIALMEHREVQGQPLLPASQMRRLRVAPVTVRAARAPRRTWMETTSSDGSLRMTRDADGTERLLGAGERWTIDDGTLNVGCVVPGLQRRGDPCWERFGVCIGRFQVLFVVDQATDYILGWSYTARPRGSYRAEDLAATIQQCAAELGLPRELIREKGISAATHFNRALELSGVKIIVANNPHQKAVEGVFNRIWTLLSLLPGNVGRFRGEEEQAGRVYEACKAGHRDPRKYFLELPQLLAAVREAVAEHNGKRIQSPGLYGAWVPRETFAKESPAWLRPFPENDAWMFSPVVRQLTVRGHAVRTPVDLMEDFKVKLTLAHEGLAEFDGRLVTVFFNPLAEEVTARVVTDANVGEWRAGTLLPFTLTQTNWVANHARGRLGYGRGLDVGQAVTHRLSKALVRTVRVERPDGAPSVPATVVRDERGTETRFGAAAAAARPEAGEVPAAVRNVRSARAALTPVSEDDFAQRRLRRERREAALAATAE